MCRPHLRLYAYALKALPAHFRGCHVNLVPSEVNGRDDRRYQLGKATGIDECAQATVVGKGWTLVLTRGCLEKREAGDLEQFAFVCHDATHKSFALCMLFAARACWDAAVHLATPRTKNAARLHGLV